MIATARLRWALITPVEGARFDELKVSFKVLQQWWEAENSDPPVQGFAQDGEWVDVPVESE